MDRDELIFGHIFDIQGFSVHDGPGCRTLIFMKGCSLRCRWCSNPEGLNPYPEPMFKQEACLFDGACVSACPFGSIVVQEGTLTINRDHCSHCSSEKAYPDYALPCSAACLNQAILTGGYRISLTELFRVITRDRNYWGSEGGITLTGGEPLLQEEFVLGLLRRCYEAYIHTAIETCGQVQWETYEKVIPFLDYILFDIKHMDPRKHQEWTGTSNQMILANARHLAEKFPGKMMIRIPVIPGFNDDEDNLLKTRAFMNETGIESVELLPLHHLGSGKYPLLGKPYLMDSSVQIQPGYTEHLFNKYFR
ncbi:MAG: glycyl-radical enzyme activating protein [Bacteroidetes bacterium]|nr:glycyl-radical enzyme activating protein [Bacteroidota bacterium]